MNMNWSSSSSSSSVAKGKKRYRDDQGGSPPSTKRRISENVAGASSSSNAAPAAAAATAGRVMTRGMMRQMMEKEGRLGNHQKYDLVHKVKMIQELPEEMKDVNGDDDDDVVAVAADGKGCNIVDKLPALVEWDDDLGWNPSWVFEEKLGLFGSWDWDWIWYPYWDLMIDNWAFDGDDEIFWEDDIWSLQDSDDNETTTPKKVKTDKKN